MSLTSEYSNAQNDRYFFTVRIGRARLDEFLKLQNLVHARLQSTKRKHILTPISRKDLEEHLDAGETLVGLSDEHDNIVAQCILAEPFSGEAPRENTALIKAFMIHPRYLKFDMITQLYRAALKVAIADGYDCVVARVADDNIRVLNSLKRNGFHIYGHGAGAVYNNPVTLLRYDFDLKPGCAPAPLPR